MWRAALSLRSRLVLRQNAARLVRARSSLFARDSVAALQRSRRLLRKARACSKAETMRWRRRTLRRALRLDSRGRRLFKYTAVQIYAQCFLGSISQKQQLIVKKKRKVALSANSFLFAHASSYAIILLAFLYTHTPYRYMVSPCVKR